MSKEHEKEAKQDLKEAAVLAIQDPGDPKKFMHGRRSDCKLWSLPGGHLHPGESREHAVVREVHEETGISIDPKDLVYLGSSEYKPQMEDYEKVLVHLYGLREPWQGDFPNVKDTDGEFDAIKFINPREHEDLYNPNGESILIDHLDHKLVPEEHLTLDEGDKPPANVGRRFYMIRIKDVSGVSGTGIVGVGVEFPDGKCVMQWQTDTSTVNNYDSMDDLIAVHGHGGHSKIVFVDELTKGEYVKKHHRVYIATDADNLGASVERAAMSNDMRKIKTMDRIIREGQEVIRRWCKRYKGLIFIDGGDDIAMFVDRRKFHEDDDKSLHVSLERMRKEYQKITGYTVTVGIGDTPSKAAKAMVYGKLQGKDRIQDWSKEAEKAVGGHKETVEEKYRKEGLVKGLPQRKWPYTLKEGITPEQEDPYPYSHQDTYDTPFNTGRRLKENIPLKEVLFNTPFKYTPGFDKSEGKDSYVVVAVRHPILHNLYLHGRRMDDHRWALPASEVLPGESRDEAAHRVLKDEFGVETASMSQIGSTDGGRTWLFVGESKPEDSTVGLMEGAPYLDVKYIDPTGKNSYHVPRYKNALLGYLRRINAPTHDLNFMTRGGFDRRKALETSVDGTVVKTELSKGSLQTKLPFNPQKDVSPTQHASIQNWVRGAQPNARDFDIKPMTGNLRTRALARIGAKTSVRKNPTTGENEYLLHRGMSPDEYKEAVKGNNYRTWRRSSWSLNRDIAETFPKASAPYEPGQPPARHVVSAWVPESAIVHYPKMVGQPRAEKPSQWTNQLYGGEDEVIADKQKPFAIATPEELQDASKHTLHQTPMSVRRNIVPDYFRSRLAELKQKYKKD